MKHFLFAIVVALTTAAVPAYAAEGSVSAEVAAPGNGAVVSGTITVRGRAYSEDGLSQVSLSVAGVTVTSLDGGGKQSVEPAYTWNTNYLPGGGSRTSNGDYSVVLHATSTSGATASHDIIVLLDNPAVPPSGLSATADDNSVTVRWSANPEPDITSYRVERSSGGGWGVAGNTSSTTFFDAIDRPGSYSYRVVALRSSPSSGSRPSAPSGSVTVSAGYSGGSSSGGSSGGGMPELPGGNTDGGGGGGGGSGNDRDGVGATGLPTGITLPSALVGLPNLPVADQFGLPAASSNYEEWGDFQEELPYDLPGQSQLLTETLRRVAARAPDRIIPPDGLRWVAAGLALLVAAALLRFGAVRLGSESPEGFDPVPAFMRHA